MTNDEVANALSKIYKLFVYELAANDVHIPDKKRFAVLTINLLKEVYELGCHNTIEQYSEAVNKMLYK